MTSLIKIEFEAEEPQDAVFTLQEIVEKIRQGYICGEGWEISQSLPDSLEAED